MIKWRNYSYKENTWEPIENLKSVKLKVDKFNEEHSRKIRKIRKSSKRSCSQQKIKSTKKQAKRK